jgi:hypothetical protein
MGHFLRTLDGCAGRHDEFLSGGREMPGFVQGTIAPDRVSVPRWLFRGKRAARPGRPVNPGDQQRVRLSCGSPM